MPRPSARRRRWWRPRPAARCWTAWRDSSRRAWGSSGRDQRGASPVGDGLPRCKWPDTVLVGAGLAREEVLKTARSFAGDLASGVALKAFGDLKAFFAGKPCSYRAVVFSSGGTGNAKTRFRGFL